MLASASCMPRLLLGGGVIANRRLREVALERAAAAAEKDVSSNGGGLGEDRSSADGESAQPPPSAPQVGASYQPLQAPYVPKAPYHQQAPPPAMATELKASEAVPVGPPSARNQQRARHRVDDVNDLEAPGRPPTPPWRARAPARNMSVAGVSGIT